MPRWTALALAICLVTVAAGVAVGAAEPGSAGRVDLATDQEFDRAQFRIAVFPNGSARWTFRFERTLANDTERRRFEGFADDFNANETLLYTDFRNQSRTLVRQGASATGREMDARGFARRAFVSTQLNDVGVVEMSFTWTGFARTDGDRVVVGDVFEGGLYVGPQQSLVVRTAEGLAFQDVEPEGTLSGDSLATSDTVTWTGERTFTDNHPRVVMAPGGAGGDTATTGGVGPGGDGTAGGTDPATGEPASPVWPVALVLVVVAAASGAFLYRRWGEPVGGPSGRATDVAGPAPVDETALIDDEARVQGLLEDHGGRMRQSSIVEATGWSKSKVSMVLSDMEAADQVRKLRVGRENIVSLPGHEPDAARSSLDEDES